MREDMMMEKQRVRVYCAGPLFNNKEKEEMEDLAGALEAEGYETFLPQRDGLELAGLLHVLTARGTEAAQAARILSRAIFALDVFQVIEACNVIFVNLNGRVPDEGAVAEAAMAWSAGKTVVGYKGDARSVFGGQDNPLVAGLFGFNVASSIQQAVELLNLLVREGRLGPRQETQRQTELHDYLEAGRKIWQGVSQSRDPQHLAALILADSEIALAL